MDFDLDLSIDVLRRTPATLQNLLGGLTDPWTKGVEGPDTFSPFDVVGHLIDGEETDWIPRARIILARARPLASSPTTGFAIGAATAADPSTHCSKSSRGSETPTCSSSGPGASRRKTSSCPASIRASVRSRSRSFSPDGLCTTWDTSRRSCG
jgi:hypothetical protein